MRHHPAVMGGQQAQDLELLLRQPDLLALEAHPSVRHVDGQRPGLDHRLGRLVLLPAAAQGGAQPGGQLGDAEGLGDVVVGATVQRLHLLGLAGADREHDHRHRRQLADPAQHLLAVDVGQAEVEDHQVGPVLHHPLQPLGAAGRLDRGIAVGGQADLEEAADLRLVVDDQDTRRDLGRVRHAQTLGLVGWVRPCEPNNGSGCTMLGSLPRTQPTSGVRRKVSITSPSKCRAGPGRRGLAGR